MAHTPSLDYRVVSIGTLAAHPLWDEKVPARTGHATTILLSAGEEHILINPGLPAQALFARMSERIRIKPDQVTQVFLTSFDREHRRALLAFPDATWLIHEPERFAAAAALKQQREEAAAGGDRELVRAIEDDLDVLDRCQPAPDKLAQRVDLFPLPGVTPGTCGLLVSLPQLTFLVCGDSIPTFEHLEQGKVLPHCFNLEQAQDSFKEAVEIADVLALGRDNLALNPLRRL